MGFWRNWGLSRRVLMFDQDAATARELNREVKKVLHLKIDNSGTIRETIARLRTGRYSVAIVDPIWWSVDKGERYELIGELSKGRRLIAFTALSEERTGIIMGQLSYTYLQKPCRTEEVVMEIAEAFLRSQYKKE